MSRTRARRWRGASATVTTVLALALALSGCSAIDGLTGDDDPESASSASPSATETPYDSQFTRDGTFQSHIDIDNLDFVYTLYPTKSTPRTNEWYPKGKKYFSFTFQAYDLDRDLRDPFRTKRKVYLDRIQVTSQVLSVDGGKTGEEPYALDAEARRITFDPEPLSTERGMLVTSPKGAFELRNQPIRPTSTDTKGIDLFFTATVWMERRAGSGDFVKKKISQKVPIAIFESDQPTQAQSIPVDAN
ncbi:MULTISPECIES: hypothetical protein [unclassified Nocardioides]|uniref:hypothetical protein n=1 Tax=unclassified Nocardioides TaxID=2615069 RepID=UPI00361BCFB7